MEWSLDKFGPRTTKLWSFEAAGALGTAAAAKAPRGRVVFQNKSVSWKSLRGAAYGRLPKTPESTIGEGGLSPHSQVSQGVPGWCGLCWGLTMGTPTSKGASVEAGLPRMARVSQEWLWVSRETPWVFREWP